MVSNQAQPESHVPRPFSWDAPLAKFQEIHLCIPELVLGGFNDGQDPLTGLVPVPSPGLI